MNVNELLSFQPEKPSLVNKRKKEDEEPTGKRKKKTEDVLEKDDMLQLVEQEPEGDPVDEISLKKMILQFEKKVLKNQEMRIKFPDMPEKFMESEVELNDEIQTMHVVATMPDMYHVLVELNAVQTLMTLLAHENTDISIAVVDLLQELTDVDTLTESDEGATSLVDALLDAQIVAQLIHNLDRLDESIKEEADGVHNTLGIVENLTEFRPDSCVDAVQQGLLTWLLKRLKAKMPFDANKLYASEVLSILLQSHDENRKMLGENDGIDVLLQQLAVYKRHDPTSSEEIEMMENLFNCLCSALMLPLNRERFLKGEGLQLMNLMLREKKLSRTCAVKVLNHAMSGTDGADNCQKYVDILGLRNIFPLFMKTPKQSKKVGPTTEELEEHVVSVIASMLRNCQGQQRQRLLNKFTENDHEKVDRLMELHFRYLEKVRTVDGKIEKERNDVKFFGGNIDDDMEDKFYLRRLEAGLFTLQLTDYVMLEVCTSGPSSIKQRVHQILNMRGGSFKTIKMIMREYAGNIGDAKDEETREAEQERLLQLVDKF